MRLLPGVVMALSYSIADRLDFTLPEFTRVAWVSDRARGVWEPRIERIVGAWNEVEWRSVAAGARQCSLTRLSTLEHRARSLEVADAGLTTAILGVEGHPGALYASSTRPARAGERTVLRVVVGRPDSVSDFELASVTEDHDRIGELLGYPPCCRHFFQAVWVDQHCIDTTWAMTAGCRATPDQSTVEVDGPAAANILWRWASVRAVPHLPCSFHCDDTVEFADRLRMVADDVGYGREMEWISEILAWPVEWSALHGIAEIKTPILKISTRTDATGGRYVVRRTGATYPEEGAAGLGFPFRTPTRRSVTDSASFRRGLENPVVIRAARPDWYHTDNGFSSRGTMTRLHAPIVALAHEALDHEGKVIDLGCGNGALVTQICSDRHELEPFGVDVNAEAINHAEVLQPVHAGNFLVGDFFETALWEKTNRYVLALLMVGRLSEVPPDRASALIDAIRNCCDQLLVYVYPDWCEQPFDQLVARAGLQLTRSGEHVGIVALH
jgi:hypothetical protein